VQGATIVVGRAEGKLNGGEKMGSHPYHDRELRAGISEKTQIEGWCAGINHLYNIVCE